MDDTFDGDGEGSGVKSEAAETLDSFAVAFSDGLNGSAVGFSCSFSME